MTPPPSPSKFPLPLNVPPPQVMHCYVDAMEFTDMDFDDSIRAFLSGFRCAMGHGNVWGRRGRRGQVRGV